MGEFEFPDQIREPAAAQILLPVQTPLATAAKPGASVQLVRDSRAVKHCGGILEQQADPSVRMASCGYTEDRDAAVKPSTAEAGQQATQNS